MSILSHTVLSDTPLHHTSVIVYSPPCTVEVLASPPKLKWGWRVRFMQAAAGPRFVLVVETFHLVAGHPGEMFPNTIPRVIFHDPCVIKKSPLIILPRAHDDHEDRLFAQIRKPSLFSSKRVLTITLDHTVTEAPLDPPEIPGAGGGLVRP